MTDLAHPGKLAAQAVYRRAHGQAEIAERIEVELVGAGRCRSCGRRLTDPESIKRGLGQDCARYSRWIVRAEAAE